MKAVFDSNIFISALAIPGGQAERAINFAIDGRVELFISKAIIHEVLDVLVDKFSREADQISRTAVFLSEIAKLIVPGRKLAVLNDEPDNRILECVVAGGVNVIVTGDKAMLNLKRFGEIQIITLRQFLDEVANHGSRPI